MIVNIKIANTSLLQVITKSWRGLFEYIQSPHKRHHWEWLHQLSRLQRFQRMLVDRYTADSHYGTETKDELQKMWTERRLEGKSSSKQYSTSCHPQSTRLMELPSVNDLLWLQIQILTCWYHPPKLKLIKNTFSPSAISSLLVHSGVALQAHAVILKTITFKHSGIRNLPPMHSPINIRLIEIIDNVTYGRRWWILCDMCWCFKH